MPAVCIPCRRVVLASLLTALVLALQLFAVQHPRSARGDTPPCGTIVTPPATSSSISHVVWIVMENKSYSSIVGSANAPYINGLAAKCGLATNFSTGVSTAPPSLPHYLAMTSGSTQGVTDDQPPKAHPLNVASIFSQLGPGGWRALEESMPNNCYKSNSGGYVVRHNPAAYYSNIRTSCSAQDVPLGAGAVPDISAPFTFITPNLTSDMHRTAANTTVASQVRAGDNWLSAELPRIFNSAEYTSGSTAVFVTWEQATSTTDHVATLVASPYTAPGTRSATPFTHYSMLKTAEELLGLPLLGNAGNAGTSSMATDFNLASPPPPPPPAVSPCGTTTTLPPVTWQHVVWVVMENKTYDSIVGSADAPYINSLVQECGVATNYYAIAHKLPKIPMTSGNTYDLTGEPTPTDHPLAGPSIFSQVGTGNWRGLEESMPSNCYLNNAGDYVVRHNPAAYYIDARTDCMNQDVPLGAVPDLSAQFTYLTPNLPHSMHGTPTNTTTAAQIRAGDAWLSAELPLVLDSPEYRSGTTAVFLTWDEGDGISQQVANVVISPYTVSGTRSDIRFDHYSMLKTTEELLGYPATLGHAADPTTASMAAAFNLSSPLPVGAAAK